MKSPRCSEQLLKNDEAPLRVGVLGCSDIAVRKFIPALAGCRGAVLTAISSRSPARAAGLYPGEACALLDHEQLLAAADIDLVYLSLPNHLHEEWAIRVLGAGKHLICEKPLGLSPESVERMLAFAESKGLLLYENLMFLHHPQHAIIREMVRSGRIGRLRGLRAVFTFPMPRQGDFRLDPCRGGGALHDLSRYPLGAALFHLQGVPASFRGHALYRDGLNTALHGTAITAEDEIFSFAMAFGQQYQSCYELAGDRGLIRLDRAFTTPADLEAKIMVRAGSESSDVFVPPCDHFAGMIEAVARLIRGGGNFHVYHERSRLIARLAREMEEGCGGER